MASIFAVSIIVIGVPCERRGSRSSEGQGKCPGTFEVVQHPNRGHPVFVLIAVQEGGKPTDGIGDIVARCDGDVVETSDEFAVRRSRRPLLDLGEVGIDFRSG